MKTETVTKWWTVTWTQCNLRRPMKFEYHDGSATKHQNWQGVNWYKHSLFVLRSQRNVDGRSITYSQNLELWIKKFKTNVSMPFLVKGPTEKWHPTDSRNTCVTCLQPVYRKSIKTVMVNWIGDQNVSWQKGLFSFIWSKTEPFCLTISKSSPFCQNKMEDGPTLAFKWQFVCYWWISESPCFSKH